MRKADRSRSHADSLSMLQSLTLIVSWTRKPDGMVIRRRKVRRQLPNSRSPAPDSPPWAGLDPRQPWTHSVDWTWTLIHFKSVVAMCSFIKVRYSTRTMTGVCVGCDSREIILRYRLCISKTPRFRVPKQVYLHSRHAWPWSNSSAGMVRAKATVHSKCTYS